VARAAKLKALNAAFALDKTTLACAVTEDRTQTVVVDLVNRKVIRPDD
jgi:hypothetical protein